MEITVSGRMHFRDFIFDFHLTVNSRDIRPQDPTPQDLDASVATTVDQLLGLPEVERVYLKRNVLTVWAKDSLSWNNGLEEVVFDIIRANFPPPHSGSGQPPIQGRRIDDVLHHKPK